MSAVKLTPRQRELFKSLKSTGGFLRLHRKITGTEVYRLMDKEFRPVKNYRRSVVKRLISYDLIEYNEGVYVLRQINEPIV